MARFAILYGTNDGEERCLIVNDTAGVLLPHGEDNAEHIAETHGDDFNDASGVFVIELPDDPANDPAIFVRGEELARSFVDL